MEKRQIPLTCGIPGTETAITAFCYGPVQGVRDQMSQGRVVWA